MKFLLLFAATSLLGSGARAAASPRPTLNPGEWACLYSQGDLDATDAAYGWGGVSTDSDQAQASALSACEKIVGPQRGCQVDGCVQGG